MEQRGKVATGSGSGGSGSSADSLKYNLLPTAENESGGESCGRSCRIVGKQTNKMSADSYAVDCEKVVTKGGKLKSKPEMHAVFKCLSVRSVDVISKFIAELLGTAMLMFVGCGTGLSWSTPRGDYIGGLGFGLTVLMIIQCFGTISGAHLNPAVTLCAVLYRTIGIRLALLYLVAQVIGAFVGYGLLAVLTPPAIFSPVAGATGHCMTVPYEGVSTVQALVLEFIATFILITLCCASWDPRNAANQDSVALKFGFAVAALSISVGPATGCSMNPARTLGPALWNNDWTEHWVYWVGPMSASVFGTLLYQAIFAVPAPASKLTDESESNS